MPDGSEDVLILNAGTLIVTERAALADPEAPSVTFTVKVEVPAVVGVPEIVPPASVNPAGSDPLDTDHAYGAVPPLAFSACEYATPTVPPGNEDVVTLNPGPLTINDSGALADTEALSVTLTVKFEGPAVVGVPVIVPPDRPTPEGRDPLATDQV